MYYSFLALIFIIAVILHLLLIRYSYFFGFIDIPNQRSVHKNQTPRAAGIAIFLSVSIAQALLNYEYVLEYFYIHAAIFLVFLVGLLDDKNNVSPRIKFIVIFFATLLLYKGGIQIDSLGSYFGYNITLPLLLIFPFTFFAIAGFTNALNLIDGLDGLAGGVSFIILSTFLMIGITYHDLLITTLSSSFIVAVGVFLFFNWNPAKIFMGDSGSLTLGFVISILSITSIQYISSTSILFIIAIPLLDTFIVITRRIQRGHSPFRADKNHLHHFLLSVKGEVRFTVILLLSIQLAFALIGFQLHSTDNVISLVLFATLFFIFLNFFDQRLKRRKIGKKSKRYRRELQGTQPDMLEDDILNPTPIYAENTSEQV